MKQFSEQKLSVLRRRTLLLCWTAYMLAYTLRVNIAVLIPVLVDVRGYSYSQMGIVTSCYFAAYMFGQLIHGYLGDRMDSKRLIIIGLAGSALCNAAMVSAPSFLFTALFWGLNGMAQSMLWPPIMKTLADWFPGRRLEGVSFTMAKSFIVGYALSWGASALLIGGGHWIWAFYLPAAAVLIYCLVMAVLFSSRPPVPVSTEDGVKRQDAHQHNGKRMPLREYFQVIGLPALLAAALSQGLIREGISIWFPSILEDLVHIAAEHSWIVLAAVPVINFGGILLVRRINLGSSKNSFRTLMTVFAVIFIAAAVLPAAARFFIWPSLFIMAALMAMTHGLTPIMTALIPFQFAGYNRVSVTVGVLNFAIYVGAALSGVLSGIIADHFGWSGVMVLWLAAAVTGLTAAVIRYNRTHRYP